jgi:hypothetical protein
LFEEVKDFFFQVKLAGYAGILTIKAGRAPEF